MNESRLRSWREHLRERRCATGAGGWGSDGDRDFQAAVPGKAGQHLVQRSKFVQGVQQWLRLRPRGLERGFQFTDDRADPHPGAPPPGCELLVQNAQGVGEAAGPLAVSPPGFTILDPLWASLLGLFLFGERIHTGALDLVVEALALALIIAGVTAGFAGPESRARRTSAPATVSVTPPARRRPLCDHPQPNPGLRNLRLDRTAA